MSGLAIIYNRDGRPADLQLMARMLDAIAHRAVDDRGVWIDGPIAMGHAALWTTPEARAERQPYRDGSSAEPLILAFDGRVDNRDELRAALMAAGCEPRNATDAELVVCAYRCWGKDSPRRIIGDFAYAIWDGKRRELFCARDTAGVRPFYYFDNGRMLLCATELHQLLESPEVPREPNEAVAAEYMCGTFTTLDETLYRDLRRLPLAHYMVANPGGIKIGRYYDLDPSHPIQYGSDDQYAEHFLEVFKEAVRCRMRAPGGVAAELSGGLDSSSIVVTAVAMQREGSAPGPPLQAFSLQFDEPECDERRYAEEVARFAGIECNFVAPTMIDYAKCLEQVKRYKDLPDYPNGASFDGLRREVAHRGLRVLLTGLGGDQWLQGSEYFLCDYIVKFRWSEAWRQLGSDRRYGKLDSRAKKLGTFLRYGVKPLLPKILIPPAKQLLRRRIYPYPINPLMANRVGLIRRLYSEPARPAYLSYVQRTFYDDWVLPWMGHVFEVNDRAGAETSIEVRHPFYDRRLIEFCFAIPEAQRSRLDLTKFVLRVAMKGLLPALVRERRDKGLFGRTFIKTFNRLGGEHLFDTLAIESMGWIDAQKMRRFCRERLAAYPGNLWPLWTTFALEIWFREAVALVSTENFGANPITSAPGTTQAIAH
jgi:asparagine synthase (glutamine-hydrolysing)